MNILITGGGGQLGRDCAKQLSPRHQVMACASAELDITDAARVKTRFSQFEPDVVINCAAYTAVDRCEEDQENCRRVNSAGPEILARQCRQSGSRLIHISTDYVFDGNKPIPEPYDENDPTNPLSIYGKSKLAGEQAVAESLEDYLILRTAWLYGMGSGNFLKTILRLAMTDPGRTLRIVDDQFGSLTWSARLAEQIEALLDSTLTGVVHATAEGFSSWYEGAVFFLQAMGVEASLVPCASEEYPTPAHRPANSILKNARLMQAGLNKMVPWQKDVQAFTEQNREALIQEALAVKKQA
jgi:dTDP-4-dehydrorhamnose reductase